MKIEDKKVVAISYEVEVEGKVVDSATEEKPLDYIQGMRMIIPMLEAALEGKEEGESFSCTIPPEEAYGDYAFFIMMFAKDLTLQSVFNFYHGFML